MLRFFFSRSFGLYVIELRVGTLHDPGFFPSYIVNNFTSNIEFDLSIAVDEQSSWSRDSD